MGENYTDQIHPNAVPASPPQIIYSTDPRNNADYLAQNPNTTIIEAVEQQLPSDFSLLSENVYDLNEYQTNEDYPTDTYISQNENSLDVPENLIIKPNSFRLQSDANDGTVVYLAELAFDEVAEAEDYEVRISIANDN